MEDCGVCLTEYVGDEAEVFHTHFRTARKGHQCYECEQPIQKGERHEHVSGKWDGEWRVYRFCEACSDISTSLTCDGSRCFGDLWDDIRENIFPAMTRACIQKLTTVKGKKMLSERWRAWKFEGKA